MYEVELLHYIVRGTEPGGLGLFLKALGKELGDLSKAYGKELISLTPCDCLAHFAGTSSEDKKVVYVSFLAVFKKS